MQDLQKCKPKVNLFVNQPEIYKNVNIEAENQDRLERFEVSFPIFVRYDGPMDLVHLSEVLPFTTKDGSQIRELLSHRNSDIHRQSLAEATLPPGGATTADHLRIALRIPLLGGERRVVGGSLDATVEELRRDCDISPNCCSAAGGQAHGSSICCRTSSGSRGCCGWACSHERSS